MIHGLKGRRLPTQGEMQLFLELRKKLYGRHWGKQEPPRPSVRLRLQDAVLFISEVFGKRLQYPASLAISWLYLANVRESAETFGYSVLYFVEHNKDI